MKKGLSLNVTLSKEQIEEIAFLAAEKVEKSDIRKYKYDQYHENKIDDLQKQIIKLQEKVVQKDFSKDKWREVALKWKNKAEQYEEKYGAIE